MLVHFDERLAHVGIREKHVLRRFEVLRYLVEHEDEHHSAQEVDEKEHGHDVVDMPTGGEAFVEHDFAAVLDIVVSSRQRRSGRNEAARSESIVAGVVVRYRVVMGEKYKRQVDEHRDKPDECDELDGARFGDERLDFERATYDIVALESNQEDGEDRNNARAVLTELEHVAHETAQIPFVICKEL